MNKDMRMVLCVVVATIATSFFGVYSADMQESEIWDISSTRPAEWGSHLFPYFVFSEDSEDSEENSEDSRIITLSNSSTAKTNILHSWVNLDYSMNDLCEFIGFLEPNPLVNFAPFLYQLNKDGMTPLDLAKKSENAVLISLYKKMHELVEPSSDEEAVSLHFVKTPPLEEESVEVFSGEKSLFFLHPRRVRSFRLSPNVMNSVRSSYSNTQQNIH